MLKKIENFSNKICLELLSISCILILLTSLVSSAALAGNISVPDNVSTDNKISAVLFSKIAKTSATEQVPIIIMLKDQSIQFNTVKGIAQIESKQESLMNFLNVAESNKKVQNVESIKIINAVAARVTPEVIASIAKRPEVLIIEPDEVVSIIDGPRLTIKKIKTSSSVQSNTWGVDKIRAPAVWQRGVTGKGIAVAVVDSGVDVKHPDLDDLDDNPNTNDPKVVGWIDYVNGINSPYDDYGHGTHVTGIISGTGANGIHTGVAPGANLIAAKVFDQSGSGYASNVILAFEWAANNGARVISYSSGGLQHYSPFTIAIDKVMAAGVIPIVAAGNFGSDSATIGCPGDEINSTTVGATDSSDNIADFSSRGPVTLDGHTYIKPDISAPGVDIESTYPGGSYEIESGTSMSAPFVTGTVALMLEKNPALKPSEIKQTLESTAVDLGPAGKDNDYGSGRIDAYEAVFYRDEKQVLPVANFSCNVTSGYAPLFVQFHDLSENATGRSWNFGDGNTSNVENPIHIFSSAKNFTVNLTVSNGNGTSSKSAIITVNSVSQKPIAAFEASPTSGPKPLMVNFADSSTGSPNSWSWNFGDGHTSILQNPKHTYKSAGTYTVCLTVKNTLGRSQVTKRNYITVLSSPVAAFSAYPTSGKAQLSVKFTDNSKGSITSWSWNFGDKSTSNDRNPVHKYPKAGKYTVTLIVKNAAGSNIAKKTNYITVK
jgi:serine protease AprX